LREAGYALGSTKYDVSVKIVIPSAFSGIIASFLLSLARAIGETMAVTLAAGKQPVLNLNPLEGVYTMTAYMVSTQSGEADAYGLQNKSLYAVGLCLFVVTLVMSIVSQWVMKRYREAYH
jgi:phosphate transport system permease protein